MVQKGTDIRRSPTAGLPLGSVPINDFGRVLSLFRLPALDQLLGLPEDESLTEKVRCRFADRVDVGDPLPGDRQRIDDLLPAAKDAVTVRRAQDDVGARRIAA